MNSTRIFNAVLLAVAVGLIAWGLSLIHVPRPAGVMQHVLSGQLTAAGDYKYTEGDQYYSIEAYYPATTTLSGAADVAARTAIEQGVLAQINDFHTILGETLDTAEKARLQQDGMQYAFAAQYKEYQSAHYDSFLYAIYEDTGGAHPNGFFKTFVFDQNGAAVTLGGLFKPGADYLARLAQAATVQVRQQLGKRLGSDAISSIFSDGLAPTAENFQNFAVEGDSLHIFFPPYQVAPYAAGTFDISIPLSGLADIVAPNVR